MTTSWIQTSASNLNWNSLACDSTGQYVVATVYNGGIWRSTNFGSTWTQTTAPTANWNSITSSSTG